MVSFGKLAGLATACACMFSVVPAIAQSGGATPAQQQDAQATGPDSEAMREMMREMMQDMMRQGPSGDDEQGDQTEGRGWGPRHGGDRMNRRGMNGRGMMHGFGGGMRSGVMHGARMKIMFAVIDANGDGSLSLQEVQDFHGRIFKALDRNGDGGIKLDEIEVFFHGEGENAR